jgi:hypothetical protein
MRGGVRLGGIRLVAEAAVESAGAERGVLLVGGAEAGSMVVGGGVRRVVGVEIGEVGGGVRLVVEAAVGSVGAERGVLLVVRVPA